MQKKHAALVLSVAVLGWTACSDQSGNESQQSDTQNEFETTSAPDTDIPTGDTEDSASQPDTRSQEDTETLDSATASQSDEFDTTPQVTFCDEPLPGFDSAVPGLSLQFDMGQTAIFGQAVGFGAGAFMTTAREDYCPDPYAEAIPLDTCLVDSSGVRVLPQCQTKNDCAAEQECEPQTDQNGNVIPDSERCVTPRAPIDVGPMTISGFVPEPLQFLSNESQNGAYMATSDGSLPADSFGYDAYYTLSGTGSPEQGLGAFEATVYMPPALELSSPTSTPSELGGIPVSTVDPMADLLIEWPVGSQPGEVQITLTGTNAALKSHSVTCRVADDGSFTIPAQLVGQAGLGPNWFLNILEVRRTVQGEGTGDGLSVTRVNVIQSVLRNIQKQKAPAGTDTETTD